MNNPTQIFQELFNLYLKYINSGLPFSHDEYNQERNALMKEVGTICQPPIIELVPKYHEKATLAQFCRDHGISTEINDFINTGLFVGGSRIARKLYDHQYKALEEAFVNRKNIIVTTGTGSGKTECFLLPVISDLVTESKNWTDNRPRAMRAMILYPLNALAEDQMIRLRKALNSHRNDGTGSLDWLDAHRGGNRFYFGRYTGNTPVSGDRVKAATKWREEKKSLIDDWNAAKEAAYENGNTELLYHVPCLDEDSAEMCDRLSMQDHAPDIMITNYSMLNIILMRDIESSIFKDTRKWLKEDSSHVFHLVIDELHSYRGTAGTEVAYLIRILLDRLGLTPDSSQIQFLASSASMEETQQTKDYLSEFFGIDKNHFDSSFRIIGNPKIAAVQKPDIQLPECEMTEYIKSGLDDSLSDEHFLTSLSCSSFNEVTKKYHLVEWLKFCLSTPRGIIARDIVKMSEKLDSSISDKITVINSLLKIICKSETKNGFASPIRAHFFFRSVNGLWGCSCPDCSGISPEHSFKGRYVGRFYKRPRTVCDCGNKVLEVLVCENCGEVYLGGYLLKREGKSYISLEKPIAENFCSYCVLWKYDDSNIFKGWLRVNFNPTTGEFKDNPDGNYCIHIQDDEDSTIFPDQCPQCEISYRIKDKNSLTPIRRHATGLQKVNQILADGIIRCMKRSHESNTKVVLFSDSRQAAAKLSAGIELNHYRDVLRWAIFKALNSDTRNVDFLKTMRAKKRSELTVEERKEFKRLSHERVYRDICDKITYEWDGWSTETDTLTLDAYFSNVGGVRLDNIEDRVFTSMVKAGINPAGPKPSVTNSINGGLWHDLFDFEIGKVQEDLGDARHNFLELIRQSNRVEQLASIFANKNKSFEDLKLGYLKPSADCGTPKKEEVLCSVIRILGSRRKIVGIPTKYPRTDSFPMQVRNYIQASYGISRKVDVDGKINELRQFLRRNRIIDSRFVDLTGEGLSFVKADVGSKYWICPVCKTIHMHNSHGICVNCQSPLREPSILEEDEIRNPNDYYLTLLNSTDNIYRLHCEELTGQTSKSDSRKRQRQFQDIFLKTEKPAVDGIDMLSVTTTMEAGVDIGSLSVVMMGNVPPQRFNYQQRVGRAGRRGNPLSIALTVAKGSSHDLTHFFETERMVSDTPKDPYLEVRTREIAERIVYKEILYSALGSSGNNESVHGSFGYVSEWAYNKEILKKWISCNVNKIDHIIGTVTRGTDLTANQKSEMKSFIQNGLVDRITEIAESPLYTQDILSERLANAGMLPMFGFPTRTRSLYLSEPKKLPWDNVVTRDVDMALNSFAPGHEIVKDKKVYKVVGVVDYEYNRAHQVVPKFDSLNKFSNPLHRCPECGYSTISSADGKMSCPVCNSDMESVKICSPLGFCVDYRKQADDFNGSFDWYSPNSDIKLDCEDSLSDCPQVKNLKLRNNRIPSQGQVHLINDNNGDFYRLGKNSEGIYISRDAYNEEESKQLHLEYESKYAFVSTKTTGVLSLAISKVNKDICLDPLKDNNPNSHAVRAAFLSWGYLVRKAISSYLDIDASELNIGYFISPMNHDAEVFLVERLENGAGYCNFLSGSRYHDNIAQMIPVVSLKMIPLVSLKRYQSYHSK